MENESAASQSYEERGSQEAAFPPHFGLLSSILDEIDQGVLVFDLNQGRVVFQNKTLVDLFGSVVERAAHNPLAALLKPYIQSLRPEDTEAVPENEGLRRIRYKNRVFGYFVHRKGGFLWMLVHDMTEKARLESAAEALELMDGVEYVFSGIRHEMGNPLSGIKMTLSVVEHNFDQMTKDTILDYVSRVTREITRLELLLRSLRHFGANRNEDVQKIDLVTLIKDLLSLLRVHTDAKGISLKTFFNLQARWGIVAPRLFQQTILQLLINAFDALEATQDPKITIHLDEAGGQVHIRVADNGCGIKGKDLENVFKAFYSTKPEATGLGLALAKRSLLKMKGGVRIESLPGRGTTVHIFVPGGNDRV